jgi:hypothetical protein
VNNVAKKFFFNDKLRHITYGIRTKVTTLGPNRTTVVLSIYFVLNKQTNQSFGYRQFFFSVLVIEYGNS